MRLEQTADSATRSGLRRRANADPALTNSNRRRVRMADLPFTESIEKLKARLMPRVGQPMDGGCLPWMGGLRSNGYGTFAIKSGGRWTQTTAHRAAYRVFCGEIPDGFEVDHLCRNRRCINPDHLEAVPMEENRRRRNAAKTHCPQGHPYTSANTRMQGDSDGYLTRVCRTCERARSRAKYQRRIKSDGMATG